MAVTSEQYARLLSRLNALEELCNDLVTVLNKTSTNSTISKVITTTETRFTSIEERLESLEDRMDEQESDPYNESE